MKHIQLILTFGLATLLNFQAHAQTIETGTRFLMFSFGMGPPPNTSAGIDSLTITSVQQDTQVFEVKGAIRHSRFIRIKNRISKIRAADTVLFYDYDLVAGDTFRIKNLVNPNEPYLFLIDSVRFIRLENGKDYRHWFLNEISDFSTIGIIWVEGLGDQHLGWDYEGFGVFDGVPSIKAVCYQEELIYWVKENYYFYFHKPLPSCDFDSLIELLSVDRIINQSLSLYPNPANNFIHITEAFDGTFQISDIYGKTVKQGKLENEIVITELKSGVYFVQLLDPKSNRYETHKIIIQH